MTTNEKKTKKLKFRLTGVVDVPVNEDGDTLGLTVDAAIAKLLQEDGIGSFTGKGVEVHTIQKFVTLKVDEYY